MWLCKTLRYKYLGVILTEDLRWSHHISSICSKTRRLLGLLYRSFYQQTDTQTLRQLYLSLVRPHLEYASSVWNPYLCKDITQIENVQKFASKICTKHWSLPYEHLLEFINLPRLSQRRLYLDLSTMYKIVHNIIVFPSGIFCERVGRTPRSLSFYRPYARTNYFYNSFVPRTVCAWNNLPASIVSSSSPSLFKSRLWVHILN